MQEGRPTKYIVSAIMSGPVACLDHVDQYGSPHSDQMTVEERYRRVDHDHLEMTLNITDPKAYVGTWKGDKKIFQLAEKPARSDYRDLPEGICVWSETKREIHP